VPSKERVLRDNSPPGLHSQPPRLVSAAWKCSHAQAAIAAHYGRIVKGTGDGSIVEFRSVVDAVNCALENPKGDGRAQ
jgi:hypothetical protein